MGGEDRTGGEQAGGGGAQHPRNEATLALHPWEINEALRPTDL